MRTKLDIYVFITITGSIPLLVDYQSPMISSSQQSVRSENIHPFQHSFTYSIEEITTLLVQIITGVPLKNCSFCKGDNSVNPDKAYIHSYDQQFLENFDLLYLCMPDIQVRSIEGVRWQCSVQSKSIQFLLVILTLTTGFIALRILIYLAFQSFDFERT